MRVVVAEDHFLVREGTRSLLESSGRIEVVAAVENARELVKAVERLLPDAVVTDIRMPPGHTTEGIEAAHDIRARHADIGVVILSQYVNSLYAFELFREGTAGLAYLLKDRVGDLDELVRALEAVTTGGSLIDPLVVERLLERRQQLGSSVLSGLTARETDVLAAMAQGSSNTAIAEALLISQSAVEKHINAIFAKLRLSPDDGAHHRRVAAVLAFLRDHDQPSEDGPPEDA